MLITIDTIDLVGASITVVDVTLPQMRDLHCSRAHDTPSLQLPEWPQYRLFRRYLTQTARVARHTLPGSQDMKAAYQDFKKQHPCPVPPTPPYTPSGSKNAPVPPSTGLVPPLTLLLAPNDAKPTQRTVIHHDAQWRIPKHHMTPQDLLKVPHDSRSMPGTCWACDPDSPTTPWPVLHLIARHHTHPTGLRMHGPKVPLDRYEPHGGVEPGPQTPVAINHNTHLAPPRPCRNRHGLQHVRTRHNGKHKHPYYPLHHSCHTPEHRTQTLTCRNLNPGTAYILHHIYSYVTQGQP